VSKGKMIVVVLTIVYILQILLSLIIYPIVGLDYDVLDVVNLTQTETIFSKLLLIISIALTPAIFEELVFRKGIIDL
jgi:membrane protease YdiL (CAAX protease family)